MAQPLRDAVRVPQNYYKACCTGLHKAIDQYQKFGSYNINEVEEVMDAVGTEGVIARKAHNGNFDYVRATEPVTPRDYSADGNNNNNNTNDNSNTNGGGKGGDAEDDNEEEDNDIDLILAGKDEKDDVSRVFKFSDEKHGNDNNGVLSQQMDYDPTLSQDKSKIYNDNNNNTNNTNNTMNNNNTTNEYGCPTVTPNTAELEDNPKNNASIARWQNEMNTKMELATFHWVAATKSGPYSKYRRMGLLKGDECGSVVIAWAKQLNAVQPGFWDVLKKNDRYFRMGAAYGMTEAEGIRNETNQDHPLLKEWYGEHIVRLLFDTKDRTTTIDFKKEVHDNDGGKVVYDEVDETEECVINHGLCIENYSNTEGNNNTNDNTNNNNNSTTDGLVDIDTIVAAQNSAMTSGTGGYPNDNGSNDSDSGSSRQSSEDGDEPVRRLSLVPKVFSKKQNMIGYDESQFKNDLRIGDKIQLSNGDTRTVYCIRKHDMLSCIIYFLFVLCVCYIELNCVVLYIFILYYVCIVMMVLMSMKIRDLNYLIYYVLLDGV